MPTDFGQRLMLFVTHLLSKTPRDRLSVKTVSSYLSQNHGFRQRGYLTRHDKAVTKTSYLKHFRVDKCDILLVYSEFLKIPYYHL